jgi:hypothetical protein
VYQTLEILLAPPHPILRVLKIDAIFESIAEYLHLKDAIALMQVCRDTRRHSYRAFRPRVYTLLRRFVSNPASLRQLMRVKNYVISGSSALRLIEGTSARWESGDLDLYTPIGTTADIVQYLSQEGYMGIPENDPRPLTNRSYYLSRSCRLNSITRLFKGNRKIDVLESASESPLQAITYFHSTLVMNYLTSDLLVVMYPGPTLSKTGIVQEAIPQRGSTWIRRYKARGYRIHNTTNMDPKWRGDICPMLIRNPMDNRNLFVPVYGNVMPEQSVLTFQWSFATNTENHPSCSNEVCTLKGLKKTSPPQVTSPFPIQRAYNDVWVFLVSLNLLSNQRGLCSLALLPDPLRQLVKENAACREKIEEMVGITMRTSRLSDGPNERISTIVQNRKHHRIRLSPPAIGTHVSSPITIQFEFGRDMGDVMDVEDAEVEDMVVKKRKKRKRTKHQP